MAQVPFVTDKLYIASNACPFLANIGSDHAESLFLSKEDFAWKAIAGV
jgi:hypothetical protein